MNFKKLLFPLLLIGSLLLLIRRAYARPASTKPPSKVSPYNGIDAYIIDEMRRFKIPGMALVIVEGDRIVHLRGFGQAHPGGEAPTPQTPFFIGSVTKSFTALAIMQLVEAGKVELDAPIQRYLPWFCVADLEASELMTVRHLLNQTSGLPSVLGQANLGNLEDRPDAVERQVRSLSSVKLERPPGTQFAYDNTNYNILGLIVEAASGESYAAYVQKHIFDPLEMRHSYTTKAEAQQNDLATGYRYWFGRPIPTPNLSIPLGSLPSGQLISCVEDMGHYLIAQLNGGRYREAQILSEAGTAEMHQGAAEWSVMGTLIGYYAMGWIDQQYGKTRIVTHSGTVPDYGAYAALIPEQKKGLILLWNVNHAMIKLTLDELGAGAAVRLAGEIPSPNPFGFLYWLMPGLLLIPFLQIAGVIGTLLRLKYWRAKPPLHISRGRLWRQHLLFPLIPNLLAALTLVPMLNKMRGWIRLFMPDYSWIATICGGFALAWSVLRTGLILRALKKPRD
jgi:CubicO group peptidase (beta-lactamase class C family)